jgi:opacity protein-like surface antigen
MNKFLKTALVLSVGCFLSSLTLVSCKSKAAVVDVSKKENRMSSNKIIENYYNNKNEFKTLYIKSNIKYTDSKQSQNVSAEIKIKKDEQILISIKYLGFIVAKASITPVTVSYYEKISGEYFEGDYSGLSQFLGTDLDFNKIQNLVLGRAMDDLKTGNYTQSYADGIFRLDDVLESNTKKSFYFDSNTFLIQKQEITQTKENRMMQVAYSNNKEINRINFPYNININTFQKAGKTQIDMEYNTISLNEELSFPYSVPNGYKRIIIK